MVTYAIHTLGCKVNSYESIGYEQGLNELGYIKVDQKEKADVYIINTCAVTNTASAKSRQRIHQAKALNEQAIIVVVGCYVQMEAKRLLEKEGVDIAIGSDQKHQLPSLVESVLKNRKTHNLVSEISTVKVFEAMPITKFYEHTRAFLKIQDGCNQFCSYCIIPFARGRERSLPLKDAVSIATNLSQSGHSEIVLAGIHSGRYGNDLGYNLCTLLNELCKIEGLKRIRISSIEINEVSDEFIEFMKVHPTIARHLHIPIQTACDSILKLMNRPYDMHYFYERIAYIRKELGDDISISSDVIVGFPSESEDNFNETIQHIQELRFSFLHVFPYSKRDQSKAALMKGQLSNQIKKARTNALLNINKELYKMYKETFIGKNLEVLFEREENGYLYGHSSEYLDVYVESNVMNLHRMCKVHIFSIAGDHLIGRLIGGNEDVII